MESRTKDKIDWAVREKKRSVAQAVGKNFLKTLTEPLTNSDSALKKKAGVAHASGLVDQLLNLKPGERIDSAELKNKISKKSKRRIAVEVTTAGARARFCRVTDAGPGMSADDLRKKFKTYAEAKAKGEATRSLFGRGLLDVLLYHEQASIYSVAGGELARCRIFWEKDAFCEVESLGKPTSALLKSFSLPKELADGGTVVEFQLKEGTRIPREEDQIIQKLSSFYMLRLIAADPNAEVIVEQIRTAGQRSDQLHYDFPIGNVIARISDTLDCGQGAKLPVDIMLARSDQPLETDPSSLERQEAGFLFVDDNDAVMDCTLLPEYDRDPYLKHLYGIVRITGLRQVLERELEADDASAVLTATRDGFDRRHPLTQKLFALVETHVKPFYEKERQRQRRGDGKRSEEAARRVMDALKVINQFNAEQIEDPGTGDPNPEKDLKEPISLSVSSLTLRTGVQRSVTAFVNTSLVSDGEVVIFESDNSNIIVEPDSGYVKARKNKNFARLILNVTCGMKNQKGRITATTLGKDGEEYSASLKILNVEDAPVLVLPEHIKFVASSFSGHPNRPNRAALLVNLGAFTGFPEITFWLESKVGNVSLSEDGSDRISIKVTKDHVIEGQNVARLPIEFWATGWGQKAELSAKAKKRNGELAVDKCKLRIHRRPSENKFSDLLYEDLGRSVLGDVADDKLYINSGYGPHRTIFGDTEEGFYKSVESNSLAQLRAASVMVEVGVNHTLNEIFMKGGAKGIQIDPDDPVSSFRGHFEENRMKIEPQVIKALLKADEQ